MLDRIRTTAMMASMMPKYGDPMEANLATVPVGLVSGRAFRPEEDDMKESVQSGSLGPGFKQEAGCISTVGPFSHQRHGLQDDGEQQARQQPKTERVQYVAYFS
jgi:hypothetical protein